WMNVAPTEDDQILQPSRDVESLVANEPEIARPEPKSLSVAPRPEHLRGLRSTTPIPSGDRRPRDPDLTDDAGALTVERLRIHDRDPDPLHDPPRAREAAQPPARCRTGAVPGCATISLERDRPGGQWSAAHHERRLGEPVAWHHGFPPKPARSERLDEALAR